MISKSPQFQTVGNLYHNFRVTKISDIPELQCQLIELIHEPTGARIMHIPNEDPENTFCLSFQTIPETSNGVAHILEHTVLCGSKKFPVKDPFFAMQRRSLNTFMNALTGADFTCYPAASQVTADFYNLLDVYIDAVFHPFLNELSFLQEGHRLEFSKPSDPTSPLEFKGVVFNEMKGALSSPSTRLNEALSQALFPDLTYGVNSGGDPEDIPKLTYKELKDFHTTYYHPSRCLFFFYGNLPLEKHLDFISKNILNDTQPVPPLPSLPLQPRFSEPRRLIKNYPISADEDPQDKTMIAFGWLTCHILEQEELLALNILQIIMMDTDASPVKLALLKSGLCKQASCYMDDEISEVPLIISLKGCNPENADQLEKTIRSSINEIILNGISLESVENAIHQLEFHRSEITGDHSPFGLSLFMRSALLKQHGGDPENGLKIHTLFDEVRRQNLASPKYLTGLLQKHLIDNPHFVRITLVPDKELAGQELAKERATLAAIEAKLSQKQRLDIVKKSKELASLQQNEAEENIDVLPKVTLDDVSKTVRTFGLIKEKIGNLEVYHHNCFTNEIVYADLIFHLPFVAEEDLSYVRLFTSLITQMGCNGRDYAKNLDLIQAHTGGINASLTMNLQATNHQEFAPSLYIRGKALHRKTANLFALLKDFATSVNFDDISRLREVIHKQYTALQSHFTQNALRYSINLSASGLDIPSKISNLWYGIEYYWMIKKLSQDFNSHAEALIKKLKQLKKQLLCVDKPHLVITSDAVIYDVIKGHKFYGLQDLETHAASPWEGDYPIVACKSQGRIIASSVAYTSKVIQTVSYIHPDAPALNIASFLLENISLHTSLREQGGAYGGGSGSNSMTGTFYLYSYRDPNIASTLAAFDAALDELVKGRFTETDLEEAKLEMIQSLDSPIAPGSRGDLAYGWLREGKTTEIRQAFRTRMLELTKQDIIKAVKTHVLPKMKEAATVVFAGKDLLESENAKLAAQGKKELPLKSI